jgi:hypothetical protein
MIAFGFVDPYFLSFIDNPQYNFPLTLIYIAIGFLGMAAGFFLPVRSAYFRCHDRDCPKWQWKPEQVWLPGILLLITGVAFNLLGFIQGLVGFQRNIDVECLTACCSSCCRC